VVPGTDYCRNYGRLGLCIESRANWSARATLRIWSAGCGSCEFANLEKHLKLQRAPAKSLGGDLVTYG
jgi:hypothetical protein